MKQTQAYKPFEKNLTRSQHFTGMHRSLVTGPGKPPANVAELPRAAIVFAIGALDAYLSEVTAEVLVSRFSDGASTQEQAKLLEKMSKDIRSLPFELAFIDDAQQRRKLIFERLKHYFYTEVSNHGWKAVVKALENFGCPNELESIKQRIEHKWNDLDCREFFDEWTEHRHEIVHQGKKTTVQRERAEAVIEFVSDLALELDKLAVDQITNRERF